MNEPNKSHQRTKESSHATPDSAPTRPTHSVDPTIEEKYWRENHATRSFALTTYTYDDFAPAYQYGWESVTLGDHEGKSFESVEADLARGWNRAKGASRLGWSHAKAATKEAWNRVKNAASALATDSGTPRDSKPPA